jgi:hypothetical protein
VPSSIASIRRRITIALVARLPRCPCCLNEPIRARSKK